MPWPPSSPIDVIDGRRRRRQGAAQARAAPGTCASRAGRFCCIALAARSGPLNRDVEVCMSSLTVVRTIVSPSGRARDTRSAHVMHPVRTLRRPSFSRLEAQSRARVILLTCVRTCACIAETTPAGPLKVIYFEKGFKNGRLMLVSAGTSTP